MSYKPYKRIIPDDGGVLSQALAWRHLERMCHLHLQNAESDTWHASRKPWAVETLAMMKNVAGGTEQEVVETILG